MAVSLSESEDPPPPKAAPTGQEARAKAKAKAAAEERQREEQLRDPLIQDGLDCGVSIEDIRPNPKAIREGRLRISSASGTQKASASAGGRALTRTT